MCGFYLGQFPQSKNMHMRFISDFNLSVGVSVLTVSVRHNKAVSFKLKESWLKVGDFRKTSGWSTFCGGTVMNLK